MMYIYTYVILSVVVSVVLGLYIMYKVQDYFIGMCVMGGLVLSCYILGVIFWCIALLI